MVDCDLINQNVRLTVVFDQLEWNNHQQTLSLLYFTIVSNVLVTLLSFAGSNKNTTKNNSFQWLLSWLLHK